MAYRGPSDLPSAAPTPSASRTPTPAASAAASAVPTPLGTPASTPFASGACMQLRRSVTLERRAAFARTCARGGASRRGTTFWPHRRVHSPRARSHAPDTLSQPRPRPSPRLLPRRCRRRCVTLPLVASSHCRSFLCGQGGYAQYAENAFSLLLTRPGCERTPRRPSRLARSLTRGATRSCPRLYRPRREPPTAAPPQRPMEALHPRPRAHLTAAQRRRRLQRRRQRPRAVRSLAAAPALSRRMATCAAQRASMSRRAARRKRPLPRPPCATPSRRAGWT
jgi:hypothetical protein